MAAACSARRVRASSPSVCGSASQVCPISSISTPRRVSIFISRAMTVCSSACSSSSLGAAHVAFNAIEHAKHLACD
jgi:hypothetical protein